MKKKLILILPVLLFAVSLYAQVRTTKVYTIQDSTQQLGTSSPTGTIIVDESAYRMWMLDSYTSATTTLNLATKTLLNGGTGGGGASSLGELSDVTLTTPLLNQFLTFNGSNWVNAAITKAVISDFTDSDYLLSDGLNSPVENQMLFYNSSGQWENTGTLPATVQANITNVSEGAVTAHEDALTIDYGQVQNVPNFATTDTGYIELASATILDINRSTKNMARSVMLNSNTVLQFTGFQNGDAVIIRIEAVAGTRTVDIPLGTKHNSGAIFPFAIATGETAEFIIVYDGILDQYSCTAIQLATR